MAAEPEPGLMPSPQEWNTAVTHSRTHPGHILSPYDDRGDGATHMECLNCPFDTYDTSP